MDPAGAIRAHPAPPRETTMDKSQVKCNLIDLKFLIDTTHAPSVTGS